MSRRHRDFLNQFIFRYGFAIGFNQDNIIKKSRNELLRIWNKWEKELSISVIERNQQNERKRIMFTT